VPPDDPTLAEADWAAVGSFPSLAEAQDHALVILAMRFDCWIKLDGESGCATLMADPVHEEAIHREFALYAAEQDAHRANLRPPEEHNTYELRTELTILWAASLIMVFLFQGKDPSLVYRFCNSSLSMVDQAEWWRPFTALFLHANIGHLLGNLLIGGVFCVLVAPALGAWRGWFLILSGGAAGNALTAFFHYPDPYLSLGASTATFAALGLLVGHGIYHSWNTRHRFRPIIAPLGAGMILLGWFGGGGGDGRTDVLGHLLGWSVGILIGLAAAWWDAMRSRAAATPSEG